MLLFALTALLLAPALPAKTAARIEAHVQALEKRGLPVDRLREAIREGLAKRAPASRIEARVRHLMAIVESADAVTAAMAKANRATLLPVTIDALCAGASAKGVTRMLASPHRLEALLALTDLLDAGAPEPTALAIVASCKHCKITALRAAIRAARRISVQETKQREAALREFAHGLERGEKPELLAVKILRSRSLGEPSSAGDISRPGTRAVQDRDDGYGHTPRTVQYRR